MKKEFAFVLLLVMSPSLRADELNWLSNYGDTLKLARTTARPLLLVVSLDELVQTSSDRLTSGQAAQPPSDFLNGYVLCEIDANSSDGKRLAKAFRVTKFPHSVIIDETTEKILYSKAGHAADDTWQVTLTENQVGAALEEVAAIQPQTTVRSQPRTYLRSYYFGQPAGAETKPQSGVWSQSRAYGRTYNFRRPPVCNT